MMRAAIRIISACIFSAMKGNATSSEMKTASILGTKAMRHFLDLRERLKERNCDADSQSDQHYRTDTTTISVKIASRETSRTSGPVMSINT